MNEIKVRCINNDSLYQREGSSEWVTVQDGGDLTIGKIYKVLSVENGNYRIIDDSGEDYIYSSSMFEVVDTSSRTEHFSIQIERSLFEKMCKIANREHISTKELASRWLRKQLSQYHT